jgi:hypothetical protein
VKQLDTNETPLGVGKRAVSTFRYGFPAKRPTPKGVFYFAHMGELTFTNVEESARKSLGITRDEYALCNYVQTWAVLPGNRTPGFCNRTRQQMAAFIGITERGILKMLGRMENEGLIERGGGFIFRITEKWFSAVVVAKTEREQSSPSNVNKVHPKREQSSPSNVNKVHPHIQNKETEVNRIQRQNAKNEFSPDTADDAPEYEVQIFEPMRVETVRLDAQKPKTSNGARRDVLQPGGNAADQLAPNWNTPEKARAMSASMADEFAEMLEKEYGVKVVTVQSGEPIPDTLGKPKKPTKMEFRPSVAAFARFDLESELDALTTDYTVAENFSLSRKIPAEKFAEYAAAFKFEARTRNDYNRRADLRGHFFNWAAKRHAAESQAQKPKPNSAPNPISRPSAEIIPANKFAPGFKILKAHD